MLRSEVSPNGPQHPVKIGLEPRQKLFTSGCVAHLAQVAQKPLLAQRPISSTSNPRENRDVSLPDLPKVLLEELLGDHLETRVKISMGSARGKVVVEFSTLEDLERIYRLMTDGATAPSPS